MDKTCKNCRFWLPENETIGACCRFPPTPLGWNEDNEPIRQWPVTNAASWCGEWQLDEDPPNKEPNHLEAFQKLLDVPDYYSWKAIYDTVAIYTREAQHEEECINASGHHFKTVEPHRLVCTGCQRTKYSHPDGRWRNYPPLPSY